MAEEEDNRPVPEPPTDGDLWLLSAAAAADATIDTPRYELRSAGRRRGGGAEAEAPLLPTSHDDEDDEGDEDSDYAPSHEEDADTSTAPLDDEEDSGSSKGSPTSAVSPRREPPPRHESPPRHERPHRSHVRRNHHHAPRVRRQHTPPPPSPPTADPWLLTNEPLPLAPRCEAYRNTVLAAGRATAALAVVLEKKCFSAPDVRAAEAARETATRAAADADAVLDGVTPAVGHASNLARNANVRWAAVMDMVEKHVLQAGDPLLDYLAESQFRMRYDAVAAIRACGAAYDLPA